MLQTHEKTYTNLHAAKRLSYTSNLTLHNFSNNVAYAHPPFEDLFVEPVDGRLTTTVPDKLEPGDDDGQRQTDEQHDEDAADVGDAERAGFALLLVVADAHARVLPPLVVQHLDPPALLHRQDGHRNPVTIFRSYTHANRCVHYQ